jgi:putative transposase
MPKARYLAPWHQVDLMEAAMAAGEDTEGLTLKELESLKGKPAIYHCLSRVVDRRFVLGDAEREQFVDYMRLYEKFCQVRILNFCVMSNHFHLLVEVPSPPEGRGADWSDEKLLRHLSCLYSKPKLASIRWELELFRKQGNSAGAEALRETFLRRLWDLSQFMKTLKQRFTRWFNKQHGRTGTLWEDRFDSILVEDGHAARTIAAYIDLNPVRAGIVSNPEDYRWCSFGEAVAGKQRAREGLQRVMFEKECTLTSEGRAASLLQLPSWRSVAQSYRHLMSLDLKRRPSKAEINGLKPLSEAKALRCKVRFFIDGVALGSQTFLGKLFVLTRSHFGPKRRTGPRKIRGIATSLCTFRDLRREPVQT